MKVCSRHHAFLNQITVLTHCSYATSLCLSIALFLILVLPCVSLPFAPIGEKTLDVFHTSEIVPVTRYGLLAA